MILFYQLKLTERSRSYLLRVLHEKLQYTGKEEGLRFIGINNYS